MLDKNKLLQVAQNLGFEIEFDSKTPGVFFEDSSNLMPFSAFEMNSLDTNFNENNVDKELYSAEIITSQISEKEAFKFVYVKNSNSVSYGSGVKKESNKKYKDNNKNERTYLENNQGVLAA